MARYVNGVFVGRPAAAADPFSQSQSLLGGSDFQLELSLPQSEHVNVSPSQRVDNYAGLVMGPGGLFEGLFEGLVDSQAAGTQQGPPAAPFAQEHGQHQLPEAVTANNNDSFVKDQRARRKALEPFDVDRPLVDCQRIISRLGKGGFATVFLAEDTRTGQPMAFKVTTQPLALLDMEESQPDVGTEAFDKDLEQKSWEYRCFKRETELYRQLGCFEPGTEKHGLPRCFESGFVTIGANRVHGFMTMQLLGKTVYETEIYKQRLNDHGRFISIAHCMLRSLQYMHKKGVIHRDVKPGNFCFNLDSNKEPFTFCIDLGLSKPAPSSETAGSYQRFGGTPDYASTRGLLNQYQGSCDDLESLAFCLLELWNGKLHWDVTDFNKWPLELYYEAVRDAKKNIDSGSSQREDLEWSDSNLARMATLRDKAYDDLVSKGGVPRFLIQWIKYVRHLLPCQEPHYDLLHDYIANSGGGVGSTVLWDNRDLWRQTKNSNMRKRAAVQAAAKEAKRMRGALDLFNQQYTSQEYLSACEKLEEESLDARSEA